MSSSRPDWALSATYVSLYLRHRWRAWRERATDENEGATDAFYRRMWQSAAEELQCEFVDLGYGFFEIRGRGAKTRVHQNQVALDHPVTLRLMATKPLGMKLLAESGIPVPPHLVYDLGSLEKAGAFMEASAGPFVVKPARLSGAGDGVTTGVESRRDLRRASVFAAFFRNELLIERQIPGDSYRLLYLEGELVDAIRRRPPSVTGDGRSTVRGLIEAENRRRAEARGSAAVRRIRIDLDCMSTLRRSGLTLSSVPAAGSLVHVKTAVNNNSFEDNESILPRIGKALAEEGARAARAMGSHLAGVDVITPDPAVPLGECGGVINEVNGEPGIHHHYNIRNPEATAGLGATILRRLLPS